MAWRVVGWTERYENNRSRELKRLNWFSMPNETDDDIYLAFVDAGAFDAWTAILMLASRSPERGVLYRSNGTPHNSETIARQTRIPLEKVEHCLTLTSRIGAIESLPGATISHDAATFPQVGATKPADTYIFPSHPIPSHSEEGTGEKPSEPFITPPSAFPPVSVSSLLPEQRWQPMATRQVLVSLPKRCQVNPRKFWRAAGEALDRIQGGVEPSPVSGGTQDECIAWLAMRARQYAESDVGKTQYAVMGWRWLEDSRYLDPPEAWTRGEEADAPRRTVEQALAEAKGKNNGHA